MSFQRFAVFSNHFVLSPYETLSLVLWQRHGSVDDEECHHTTVTPEGPVEAHQVKEERIEFDSSEHIYSSAGTTDTRGVRPDIKMHLLIKRQALEAL